MRNKKIGIVVSVTIIITAFLTFLATTAFYAFLLNGKSSVGLQSGAKILQTVSALQKHYYYGIDEEELVDSTLKTMLSSLGDPYTAYMNADEYKTFAELITGTYAGIGTVVLWDDELKAVTVVNPFENSPAEKAGLVKGDKIIEIDGEDFANIDFESAVSKMKGERGTNVILTVLKADSGEKVTIEVTRDEIQIPSVASKLRGNIGHITISMFDMHTGEEFSQHLNDMLNQGAKGIILDLRDNGGGLVESVTSVSNQLLKKDEMIFYTENKAGKKVVHKSTGNGVDLPIAVLINENTASASELLAGALRDNKATPLIGKKSFGKGVVQMTYPLSDGSVIKLTVEKYFTPNGNDINNNGLKPDYEVGLSSNKDEQYQMAEEVIKNLMS
ncbi:MAG: S41 family peptidase [Firmicutes bacterium]|nr:S41 family peptidase [Bacillota bacterium]